MLRFRSIFMAAASVALCVAAAPAQTTLRVALFPYLPDVGRDTLAAMAQRIEAEFEAANPGIDLQLRRMNPEDGAFYEPDSLRAWLTAPAGQGYDLVEVDAIMLGDLAGAGYLTPWAAVDSSDWNNAALPALMYEGVLYGIPHWLCGDFILTRAPLDPAVVAEMEETLDFCELGSVNTCLAKDTYTPDSSVAMYASGRADAFLGFSERLTAIMMAGADGSQVRISPAPLGPGNTPVLYVDALTLRRGCDAGCQAAAAAFAKYLLDPRTYGWILLSQDAPQPAPPRYLLPATWSAFGPVLADPHFRDMLVAIHGGVPLPNTGFAANRKTMQAALLNALQ
jgi:ABC-type glycerol-3-phosphate transport system substrate-binding protein